MKIQIYVALIAFLLLRLFHNSHARGYRDSAKALIARLRVALFDPFDLSNRRTSPPIPPQCRPIPAQNTLNLLPLP